MGQHRDSVASLVPERVVIANKPYWRAIDSIPMGFRIYARTWIRDKDDRL